MKKLAVLFFVPMLLVACGKTKDEREIERVAYGYLDAMGNYRINDAVEFSSSGTCETTIPVFNKMMEISDSAKLMENTPADIEITGVRILSDTTARAYFHKHTPIKEQDDSVLLVREDGRWLVDVQILPPPFLDMPGSTRYVVLDSADMRMMKEQRERFVDKIRQARSVAQ
mgnify:CR=1 FL=1